MEVFGMGCLFSLHAWGRQAFMNDFQGLLSMNLKIGIFMQTYFLYEIENKMIMDPVSFIKKDYTTIFTRALY